jgi:hypothetical protein
LYNGQGRNKGGIGWSAMLPSQPGKKVGDLKNNLKQKKKMFFIQF